MLVGLMADKIEPAEAYASFMTEIKLRFRTLRQALERIKDNPESDGIFLEAEFGYLQMRYICELIALSSLAVHEPHGLNAKLYKSWHAGNTFRDLQALNQNCFPLPVIMNRNPAGIQFQIVPENAMTIEDIQDIYNKCGEVLHRGVIKHLIRGDGKTYDVDKLNEWAGKIVRLLQHHAMMILDKGQVFLVNWNGGHDGSVQVVTAQADGPAILVPPAGLGAA